jgi:hypothetical protein
MTFAENSRRAFLKQALLSAFAVPLTRKLFPAGGSVVVRLEGQADDPRNELVSFGLPLPSGFLNDASRVRVVGDDGAELVAAVRSLEPWRVGGKAGSIRSLLIQFPLDFSKRKSREVTVWFDRRAKQTRSEFASIASTLRDEKGLRGPRVLALLPAEWLCASGIVGPQTPAALSGSYSSYDQMVEKNFPGSLAYLDSLAYANWLFDRTACYYKMYVRSGDGKYLQAAYHAANFVREHTKLDGPDAGIFTLKGPDLKYVYPRAMHIHYLLTGDERALACGKLMAEYCFNHQDPVYRPAAIKPVPLGVDPEKGRNFWTLRHQGYGLLGILHGWEMTGDRKYWTKARECVDAYYKHQRQPPDGHPPDGSLRQNWELYDPNEATFPGATSAWMMALLLDPIFHYWTLTRDSRVPEIVVKWCDFLDRQGIVPDGSKAYYVINCFAADDPKASPGELGPDMEMHNTEMAYTFALGLFFTRDAKRKATYAQRLKHFLDLAVRLDMNRPARAYNWAFQFTSQLVYFAQHRGEGLGHIRG